ncbi:MAG: D-tyrosyl-tRNA(Tyr) deacylase [Spirochaetales bacterium]|nr:D-tyrosyl-tRNA(Tyr) deacylase [Spirochaetales bacterium]
MKAVVQRVRNASVKVDNEITGQINDGILVYIGFSVDDDYSDVDWMVKKIPYLRLFKDTDGKMNLSVIDLKYEILIVSQFTLLGDCNRGRRPSYDRAARPDDALKLYNLFIELIKKNDLNIECGKFQAHMDVEYINDGPVTLILDSKE